MKTVLKTICTVIFIVYLVSNLSVASRFSYAENDEKYILYLSSYSFAWESVPLQIDGIKKALDENCLINYEFMDTKNVNYGDDYKEYYQILKYKLSQRPAYDGILVADDAALNFVVMYKDELFPDIPVAFMGIDNLENAKKAAEDPDVCGIVEDVDYASNIGIARRLRPKATKIVFINDRKENGIGIQKQLENSTEILKGLDVSFIMSPDYTREELETKIESLGEDTILFVGSLGQGKDNVVYTQDMRREIIKHASIPVFASSSVNFSDEFLGGFVVDQEKSAYIAAKMINDTLNNGKMNEKRLVENTPSVFCFNQEKMKEFGIQMEDLPQGTIIRNPIPTFLSEHYKEIVDLSIILSILLFIILVVTISLNLKQSRRNYKIISKQNADLEKALRTKTDFLSRMSHEMRTPLNSILGYTHLAMVDDKSEQEVLSDLKKIDQSGKFLLNLINDILDVSRIEAEKIELQKEWCSPGDVLDGVVNMMTPIFEEKNITFIYPKVLPQKIQEIEWNVDVRRLQQILVNLLNNAAKFTSPGGKITFAVMNMAQSKEYLTDKVVISDTGCGMTKEFITHIGEPFSQEKNMYSNSSSGTGLGLYIVKKFVELMDGELSVESEVGKGSSFSFTISYRYREKNEKSKDTCADSSSYDLAGMKVLYAEDNELNQILGKRLLENEGINVTIADNGAKAVNLFLESEPGDYDAILMDMRMPVMSGLDATEEIRGLDRSDALLVPIIALSAETITEEIQKAMEKGISAYLTKPIVPDSLYMTLGKLDNRSS